MIDNRNDNNDPIARRLKLARGVRMVAVALERLAETWQENEDVTPPTNQPNWPITSSLDEMAHDWHSFANMIATNPIRH